jgi:putative flippase GtrA
MVLKFMKFLIAGLLTAIIYFGIYLYLANLISPILATIVAFPVAVAVSYFLNSVFVFTSSKGSFKIFLLIAFSGLFLNMLLIFIFTELVIKNSTIAGAIVVTVIPIHNFLLNYKLNFK